MGTVRSGETESGPGVEFMPFVVMEDLLDKLKLLNYELEFVAELKMRPLNRHYFVLQTNPGEQFFMFTSLSSWLMRKAGQDMDQPQEFDDPNTTISNILDRLRRFGVTIDFAPSKLKQGFGEQALFVLDRLSDEALRHSQFSWHSPEIPQEEARDEEEDDIIHIDDYNPLKQERVGSGEVERVRPDNILESDMDTETWRLEVERVAPSLKITVKNDSRDWRQHLDQMHQYRSGIDDSLTLTKSNLDK